MRLSKLTLVGFKSFADATEFRFDDPITGIVGPNGCGKSNVVDAVKWVLGERSSKSLRGKEMIDVIFAGSAGRPPAGMASVTLSFDNPVLADGCTQAPGPVAAVQPEPARSEPTDPDESAEVHGALADEQPSEVTIDRQRVRRGLPIDSDVVEVERRLYRDGTSQYLINGRRARLRDIRELFLDTGIGADAYSIIEQGKVDAMLLASPMERRTIFEEAAGVARFKQRRIEASRKLERTEQNLAVTREQLASTERRLKVVRGQAVRARRFRELDSELRALQQAIALVEHRRLVDRLGQAFASDSSASRARTEAIAAVEALDVERALAEDERRGAADALHKAQREAQSLEHERSVCEQRSAMLAASLADLTQRSEDERRLSERAQGKAEELAASVDEALRACEAIASELAQAEVSAETCREARASLMERSSERRSVVERARQARGDMERQLASIEAELRAGASRLDAIQQQQGRLAERAETLHCELEQRRALAKDTSATVAELTVQTSRLEREVTQHTDALSALSLGRRELAQRVAELEHEHVRLQSRRQTLADLARTRAGFGEAVRAILAQRSAGGPFEHALGALADFVQVASADAAIVELGLGDALRAIVVPTLGHVPSEEALASLAGRVTFVALGGAPDTGASCELSPSDTLPEALRVEGVRPVRPMVAGVHASSGAGEKGRIDRLLDTLLAGTVVVDSLESARMLRLASVGNDGRCAVRFVTRSGVVVEPDGRVVAGPASGPDGESMGVLQRRAELDELDSQLVQVREKLGISRAELERVDDEAASHNRSRSLMQTELETHRRAQVAAVAALERAQSEAERLARQSAELLAESDEISLQRERLIGDRATLEQREAALTAQLAACSDGLAQAEAELASLSAEAEQAGEALGHARVLAGRLVDRASASRREHAAISQQAQATKAQAAEHARRADAIAGQRAAVEGEIAELRERVESLRAALAEASDAITDRAQRHASIEASERRIAGALAELRQEAQACDERWRDAQVHLRELEVRLQASQERARFELGMDLAAEAWEYDMLFADGGLVEADPARDTPEADRLRALIKDLGSVNLGAIEEESQLAGRNEELVRQVADLDEAQRTLSELIAELDDVSRTRFAESLERVKEHFAGPDGMFRKLFGGGRAEVRLMPVVREVDGQRVVTDEIDVLESGIEIVAKPPGKEPRALSQLSGGEKTLTAVALLLAIFQSKPSCFCVLDEVDAALDEANVGRYIQVIRQFTDRSHFIVITHNKKTMRGADRLFGVTMQERGVSTRVAVKFEQVEREAGRETRSESGHAAQPGRGAVEVGASSKPETAGVEPGRLEPVPSEQAAESSGVGADHLPAKQRAGRRPSLRAALASMRAAAEQRPGSEASELEAVGSAAPAE